MALIESLLYALGLYLTRGQGGELMLLGNLRTNAKLEPLAGWVSRYKDKLKLLEDPRKQRQGKKAAPERAYVEERELETQTVAKRKKPPVGSESKSIANDKTILDSKGVPIGANQGLAKPGLPPQTLSKEGWPDLPGEHAQNFNSVEPVNLKPGTKIYRIIDEYSNPAGGYWAEELPVSRAQWRGDYAVKLEWNTNGKYVEYTVPEGPGLNVWKGETSAQALQGSGGYNLPGGAQQIWMPPNTVSPGFPKFTGW